FEVLVDQDGPSFGGAGRLAEEADHLRGVLYHLHGAPAEHERRPYHHRVADGLRRLHPLLERGDGRARRLGNTCLLQETFEQPAVLRRLDDVGAGADDGQPGTPDRVGQVDGRLAAKLHDAGRGGAVAFARLVLDEVAHALLVQRLEVEAVARVEVRGDGLGVGIGHDGAIAGALQRPGGVHTRVVELDALADADGPAADDDRGVAVGWWGLVLLLVGAVVVRC